MFLLPFDEFVIESALSEEAVEIQLKKHVEPEALIRSFNPNEPFKIFEGDIVQREFTIRRIVKHALFGPVIKGQIEKRDGKTRITVRVRIVFFVMAVMIFLIGLLYISTAALPRGQPDVSFSAIALVACYILTMVIYVCELNTAREILLHVTEGQLVEED